MILAPRKRILTPRSAQRGFFTLPGGMGVIRGPGGGGGGGSQHFEGVTYTGDGSYPRTIGSSVDTTDGVVWVKRRDSTQTHQLLLPDGSTDYSAVFTNASTPVVATNVTRLSAGFRVDSYSVGSDYGVNTNGQSYVAWLFAKQAGFLDIVTYTGNGSVRTISHSLGQAPGMVIIRQLDASGNWNVFHKQGSDTSPWQARLRLETAASATTDADDLNNTAPTSTQFTLGTGDTNTNGVRYVAILIADDSDPAGVSRCGTYTGNGSATGPSINLGWDPRFLLIKQRNTTRNWIFLDTIRTPGFVGDDAILTQATSAESSAERVGLTGSGFEILSSDNTVNANSGQFIYLAIR